MPNEEVKTEEKVTENVETKQEPVAEKEKPETQVEEKVEDKVEEKVESEEPEMQGEEPTEGQPRVEGEQTAGNGIRLEDLVTKEELSVRLQALEAKYEAVIKENQDLKDKYENRDFGNFKKQGMVEKDNQANSTFDEYSKAFM